MIQYIYFVKCSDCEDEPFDFFDEAKQFALGCLSKKPIITQIEVDRNDFGECTDSCDLGTVWSWEDVMKETDAEPAISVFTKDDLEGYCPDCDPEFDNLDNSLDFEVEKPETSEVSAIDKVPDSFRKPIPEDMTIEQLVEEMEENEDTVECTWCSDLFDKDQCRKEVNLGYLCSRCEAAIKSRGEKLTFEENNYWDFLDESASSIKPFDPKERVEFEYKDIEVTVELGRDQGWDDYYGGWDEPIEKDFSGNFIYEVEAQEVAAAIWEYFLDDEIIMSLPGGPEAMECENYTDEASLKFWGLHFEDLLKKYYDKLLEFFRDPAEDAAAEAFTAEYYDNLESDDYYEDD